MSRNVPHVNRFRAVPTATLLSELEAWRWELAELNADPSDWDFAGKSRAYIVATLEDLDAELGRRERVGARPEAPCWPAHPASRRDELDRIKAAISVRDVFEKFSIVELRKVGRHYRGRCPIHNGESDTSLVIADDGGWFYCHGCGAGGDVFEAMRQLLGIADFGTVVDLLAREAGIARADRRRAAPASGTPALVIAGRRVKPAPFGGFAYRTGKLVAR